MAIVNCTECDGKVSTRATSCPHCGAPRLPNTVEESESRADPVSADPPSLSEPAAVALMKRDGEVNRDAIARIVEAKVWYRLTALVCFAIGIAIIVYPTDKSLSGILDAVFTTPPGYSKGWLGMVANHWPSCLLFLAGKITWDSGK